MREVQRGSTAALEELFRREWPRAYRAAYLVVHDAAAAEDIAQEAFLAAVRAIDRFDRRRPFGPWMHRIVVNRAIDVDAGARAAPRGRRRRGARRRGAARSAQRAALGRRRRRAGGAEPGAPRGRGAALRLRLHARRDRARARHAARHRQLAPAPRARPPRRGDRAMTHRARTPPRPAAARRGRGRGAQLAGGGGGARRAWPAGHAGSPRRVALRLALVAVLPPRAAALALSLPAPRWATGSATASRGATAPGRPSPRCRRAAGAGDLARGAPTWSGPRSTRRLGSFSQAGWSPHGLHVVGVQGRRVIAVTGRDREVDARAPRAVHDPAWSTATGSGWRTSRARRFSVVVRERRSGDDHRVWPRRRRGHARLAPAQRPLADLRDGRRARSRRSTSTAGDVLWRSPVPASFETPRALAWLPTATASSHSGQIRSRSWIDTVASAARSRCPASPASCALHPPADGRPSCSPNRVLEHPPLEQTAGAGALPGDRRRGRLVGDGRRLLMSWSDTDQWLMLGPGHRVRALHGGEPRARRRRRLSARGRLVLRRLARRPLRISTTCWNVGRLIQWISGCLIAPSGRWRTAS